LFPLDVTVIVCVRCDEKYEDQEPGRFDAKGKPNRVAIYFPLADHIKAVFGAKTLAKQAKYAWNRPAPPLPMKDRELEDVWDGAIMHELYHDPDPRIQPQSTVYTSLSFDGVEVRKNVSCTLSHRDRIMHGIPFVSTHT
jgi:hypothetical protein